MAVVVSCPSCGEVTSFLDQATRSCPRCTQPYPEPVYIKLAAARASAIRPVLLQIGMVVSTGFASLFALCFILAPLGIGTYTLDGEPSDGMEFLRVGGVILGAQALLLGSIAFALWSNRSWSRPLMVAYWLVSGAALLTTGPEAGCGAMLMLIPAGLAAAYLYGSEGPKAYYQVVAQRERAAT